jgi:uncharacterized membrane protein YphA (DoxX/SURF4 family)
MMDNLELRPGRRNALAAASAETTGGTLLALGALTPVAGALITGTMVTAIRKVHWPNAPWNQQQGYEYNLASIAVGSALAIEAGRRFAAEDPVEAESAADQPIHRSNRFARTGEVKQGEKISAAG